MPTPAGAVKLGSELYLFAAQTQSTDCIIDAHGGYMFECRTFTVPPNLTLIFYSQHGQEVTDPGQGALRLAEYHERGQRRGDHHRRQSLQELPAVEVLGPPHLRPRRHRRARQAASH